MNRRLKYFLLALSVILISTYLILPDWFKEGTSERFMAWYPTIGFIVYIGIQYVFPFLIFTLFTLYLFLFLWIIGKQIFVAKNYKRNMYSLILLVLIGQFYICFNYQEFYPAVIMPRFTNGKHFEHPIKNVRGEVYIRYDENKVAKLDAVELLSSFHGNHASKNFIVKRMLKKIQHVKNVDWIINAVTKIIHSKDINELHFYKIEEIYQYEGMNGLKKMEEQKENIFSIKMK